MKFLISGESADPGSGSNSFTCIAGTLQSAWNTGGETGKSAIVPSAMNLLALVFDLYIAPGAGNSRTFTVYKNGAPTALTVTISDTATQATITGQSIAYAAGDTISMAQTATTGTPTFANQTRWSVLAESVGADYFNLLGGGDVSISGTSYRLLQNTGPWRGAPNIPYQVFPLSGTLTKFYAQSSVAPGSGKAWDLSIQKNGTASAATLNYGAAESGVKSWTGSIAIAAGDTVGIEALATGTPAATQFMWSATVVPDVPGESVVMYGSYYLPSTTAIYFDALSGEGAAWTGGELPRYTMLHAAEIRGVYAQIGTAPGGAASWTFSLRYQGSDTAAAVTITGAQTIANAAFSVAAAAGRYSLKCTPAGSPAAMTGGAHVGFRIFMQLPGADLAGDALAQASASGSLSEQYQPTAIAKWANIAAHRDWANVAKHRNWGNP